MKCLETRTKQGIRWRRYRLEDGRTMTTYEVPCSVLRSFPRAKLQAAIEAHDRGEQRRSRTHRIDELVRAGWKPAAIAHETGVTEAAVRLRRKVLQGE